MGQRIGMISNILELETAIKHYRTKYGRQFLFKIKKSDFKNIVNNTSDFLICSYHQLKNVAIAICVELNNTSDRHYFCLYIDGASCCKENVEETLQTAKLRAFVSQKANISSVLAAAERNIVSSCEREILVEDPSVQIELNRIKIIEWYNYFCSEHSKPPSKEEMIKFIKTLSGPIPSTFRY